MKHCPDISFQTKQKLAPAPAPNTLKTGRYITKNYSSQKFTFDTYHYSVDDVVTVVFQSFYSLKLKVFER